MQTYPSQPTRGRARNDEINFGGQQIGQAVEQEGALVGDDGLFSRREPGDDQVNVGRRRVFGQAIDATPSDTSSFPA
jgi:hypothetical protein